MTNFLKKGILAAALFLAVFSASAAEVCNFYMKNCAIKAGGTADLEFYIDNNADFINVQFQIFFPESISLVDDGEGTYFVKDGIIADKSNITALEIYDESTRNLRVIISTTNNKASIKAGGGKIGHITVKADETSFDVNNGNATKVPVKFISSNGDNDTWSGNLGTYGVEIENQVKIYAKDTTNYIYPSYDPNELGYHYASPDFTREVGVDDNTLIAVFYHKGHLYCKDDNGVESKDKDNFSLFGEEAVDYMKTFAGIQDTYDESNWVDLTLPETVLPEGWTDHVIGHKLSGVLGTYTNYYNKQITLAELPNVSDEAPEAYNLNTYIAASFQGTQQGWVNPEKYYLFVKPKPMEVANVQWAQWDASNKLDMRFKVPTSGNAAGLSGCFYVDLSLLDGDRTIDELKDGHTYSFKALIVKGYENLLKSKKKVISTPNFNGYIVYPFELSDGTITSVTDINTNKAKAVRKVMENGRIVIYNGDEKYDMMGSKIQ